MTPEMTTGPWIATEATVTSCRFQFARLNTLRFGIQSGEKFRIVFDYYAHGRLYTNEFQSPVAVPQNQRIPVTYNPLRPEQNSLSKESSQSAGGKPVATRSTLLTIGISGSIVLSLLWLAILRGCS
jgi:hypothetical protein